MNAALKARVEGGADGTGAPGTAAGDPDATAT
jgi:hypothetical protein